MTKNFNDILDRSVKFGDSQRVCFKNGFEAGQQSKQAEVDELRKHKEILLGELFLVSDAIQYHRVLNLLKGENHES